MAEEEKGAVAIKELKVAIEKLRSAIVEDPFEVIKRLWEAGATGFVLPSYVLKIIPEIHAQYSGVSDIEGTVESKLALEWLTTSLLVAALLPGEVSEFFTEGLSEVFQDLFERMFKSRLELIAKIKFGAEGIDDDEIKDVASTNIFSNKWLSYGALQSGMWTSSAYMEVATGKFYAFQEGYRHLDSNFRWIAFEISQAYISIIQDARRVFNRLVLNEAIKLVKDTATGIESYVSILNDITAAAQVYSTLLPTWDVHTFESRKNDIKALFYGYYETAATLYNQTLQNEQFADSVVDALLDKYFELVSTNYAEFFAKLMNALQQLANTVAKQFIDEINDLWETLMNMRKSNKIELLQISETSNTVANTVDIATT